MNKVKPTIRSIAIASSLVLTSGFASFAQAPAAPPAGPIDITANEQEFSGEQVIARGNVRVVYKESVILAPVATLFRDAGGNPARAIFTGHPRLSQGTSKIDAETLTFEIAQQKIVATGNAHSEVEGESDEKQPEKSAEKPAATSATSGGEGGDTPAVEAPAATPAPQKAEGGKKGDKIITDADRQEYDQATGRFDAIGHVRVRHGDISVNADKLQLVYGTNNKPETAVFTGNVHATQNKNTTSADQMTYSLTTKRLQATGNVRSKVIQEKKEGAKKPGPKAMEILPAATAANTGVTSTVKSVATATTPANAAVSKSAQVVGNGMFNMDTQSDKPIYILSDAQDYSRDNGRVTARGNVKVVCGDTIGIGPQIVLTKNAEGQADKVYFTGRSQISQPGRRWIADTITFIVDEHRVVAHGNSRAMILQGPKDKNQTEPGVQPSKQSSPNNGNMRLAEPPTKKKPNLADESDKRTL